MPFGHLLNGGKLRHTVNSFVPATFRILIEIANSKHTITYKDLASIIGTQPVVVPKILNRLHATCVENNWPPLNALVINIKTGKPSEAFLHSLLSEEAHWNDRIAKWNEILNEIYSYNWTHVLSKYEETS